MSTSFALPVSEFMEGRLKKVFSGLSEQELRQRVNEFLKYIYLLSVNAGLSKRIPENVGLSFIPVKRVIDDVWHEYILQTREYLDLCNSLPSKKFIHHKSGTFKEYSEEVGLEESMRRLLNFLPGYVKYFGNFDDNSVKYWIIPDYIVSNNILSLENLNYLLKNELDKNPNNF